MNINVLNKYPTECRSLFFSQSCFNFVFYGIKSIFILFIIGNYNLSENVAISILATYMVASYATSIFGGWIADSILGIRVTIFLGGVLQTLGLGILLIPGIEPFYISLSLLSLGTGLLKPALSTAVGATFTDPSDSRKDGAYSAFYIAMNFGSLTGPLCLGVFSQIFDGYEASIILSLFVSLLTIFYILKKIILKQEIQMPLLVKAKSKKWAMSLTVAILSTVCLTIFLLIRFHEFVGGLLGVIAIGSLIYFAQTLIYATPSERKGMLSIIPYIVLFAFFCSLFEQEGNSILLFFEKAVDRNLFGFKIPSPLLLSLGPVFVLLAGPFIASFLEKLSLIIPKNDGMLKLGIGFGLVAISFFILSLSCFTLNLASPIWVIGAIFIQTLGELFIVPVGFSNVSKLSPKRFRTLMMSFWLMAIAYGNYFAGFIAQFSLSEEPINESSPESYFNFFISLGIPSLLVALLLITYFIVKTFRGLRLEIMKKLAAD